jgi:hypothetical protein
MKMNVEDLIASGNKAVARVKATATHKGEFMRVPPTGNAVAIQLIDIMSFDDAGLVCEHWGVADLPSLMQLLGGVPAGPSGIADRTSDTGRSHQVARSGAPVPMQSTHRRLGARPVR